MDYPRDRLEVLIGSDGSNDKTCQRAKEVHDSRVRVLEFAENRGRAWVHNDAVAGASGDIIVFTDAATRFDKNFVCKLMANFKDPQVGCVSGVLHWVRGKGTDISSGSSMYWRVEYWLRKMETRIGAMAVASGACMGVRRSLYRPLADPTYDVDFITPLDVINQGFRVVREPEALATDYFFESAGKEFSSRVRITLRNFPGTLKRWRMIGFFRFPQISFALLSHQFLRWLTPFFMIGAFSSNLFLLGHPIYRFTMVLQVMLSCT